MWTFRTLDLRREGSLLLPLQGVVYDRGATGFARSHQGRGEAGDVVVVAIKDSTYKDLGDRATELVPSFVPGVPGTLSFDNENHRRAFHARLLENLTSLGAKVVVFDIVFGRDVPGIDDYLAKAIEEHGNVVLAGTVDSSVEGGGSAEVASLTTPNLTLYPVSRGVGVANVPLDADKTVRRFQWWTKQMDPDSGDDAWFPALGVAGAALFHGKDPRAIVREEIEPKGSFLGRPIVWRKSGESFESLFRYYGETGSPAGPASLVNYENVVRRGQDEAALEALRRQIRGKLVVVGDETLLSQDYHRVPVLSRTSTRGSSNQMPGVEIQAHIAQSALRGEYFRHAPESLVLLLVLACCLLTAAAGRALPAAPTAALALALVGVLSWGSAGLLASSGTFVEPVTACLGIVAALIGETGFMYVAERRERQAVRRQLSRQVGSSVAAKLTDEDWPELSGEAREITMLFSDLQGFTSISESMTSPEICALLNRYFGIILPIVGKYRGTLDKLMGDGMMVWFGWPERRPDHAERAIRCALEMQEALERWQRQPENAGMPPLRTRVGVHTGIATVGEIGGSFSEDGKDPRVEFTVIGDVVNVASRLEGMNKDFGTTILISDAARAAAGEFVPMKYEGVATVRGRKEPMPVYSVDAAVESSRQRTQGRSASIRVDPTGPAAGGPTAPP